jgi:hypothetical protein
VSDAEQRVDGEYALPANRPVEELAAGCNHLADATDECEANALALPRARTWLLLAPSAGAPHLLRGWSVIRSHLPGRETEDAN